MEVPSAILGFNGYSFEQLNPEAKGRDQTSPITKLTCSGLVGDYEGKERERSGASAAKASVAKPMEKKSVRSLDAKFKTLLAAKAQEGQKATPLLNRTLAGVAPRAGHSTRSIPNRRYSFLIDTAATARFGRGLFFWSHQMASIYKPTRVDPHTGEANQIIVAGELPTSTNTEFVRSVKGFKDKDANGSQGPAKDRADGLKRQQAGVPIAPASKPMQEAIDAYIAELIRRGSPRRRPRTSRKFVASSSACRKIVDGQS